MAQRSSPIDERRRAYSAAGIPQADTYRPNEIRGRDRSRNRDRELERDRDRRDDYRTDRRSDQRSPDRRDGHHSDKIREPDARPKNLTSLDTNMSILNAPTKSRKSMSSPSISDSPAVGRSGVTTVPEHSMPTVHAATSPSITTLPLPNAKDPKVQPVLNAIHNYGQQVFWQNIIGADRTKKKKELEKRAAETKKWEAQTSPFPQQRELLKKNRERDLAELKKLDTKWKLANQNVNEQAETLGAAIVAAQSPQAPLTQPVVPAFPDSGPSIAALEKKFAAFEIGFTDAQIKIKNLEGDLKVSDEMIQNLRSECTKTNGRMILLESECKTAKKRIQQLEELTGELPKQDTAVKTMKEAAADMEKRINDYTVEKTLLKENMASVEMRVSNIERENDHIDLRESFEKLERSFKQSLADQKATARKDVNSVRSSVTQLKDSIDLAEITEAVTSTDRLSAEILRHEQGLTELERRFYEQEKLSKQHVTSTALIESLDLQLDKRMSALESKMDQLDTELIEQVLDQWSLYDGEQVMQSHEEHFPKMLEDVRYLTDSMSNRDQPRSPSANHILQQDFEEVQSSVKQVQQDVASITDQISGVEPRLMTMVKQTVEEANDAVAEMIDDLTTRVDGVSLRVDTLEAKGVQARTPAPTPQLDSRDNPASVDLKLAARIKAIEDEKLGHGFSRLTNNLSQLFEEVRALSFSVINNQKATISESERIKASQQEYTNSREADRSEVRGQLEQHELQLQNLNGHFSGLNTQKMAHDILKHLDSYTSKFGPKFEIIDNHLKRIDHLLGLYTRTGATDTLLQQQGNKRVVSPQPSAADASKRRRVDANGGHALTRAVQPTPSASRSYQ